MQLLLLLALAAFTRADFSGELDRALLSLEKSGLEFIGDQSAGGSGRIYLKDIRHKASSIKVEVIPELKKPAGASRFSAFYHPASNTIYVSQAIVGQTSFHALAIHESLGILGLPDQDYEISVALSLLLRLQEMPPSDFTREVSNALYRYLQSHLIADWIDVNHSSGGLFKLDPNSANQELAREGDSGGGTLVGGAGDLKSLVVKESFALKVLEQWHDRWNKGLYGKNSADREDFFFGLTTRLVKDFRIEPRACDRPGIFYAETERALDHSPVNHVQFPPNADSREIVSDMLWYWQGRTDWKPSEKGWHPNAKDPVVSYLEVYQSQRDFCALEKNNKKQ